VFGHGFCVDLRIGWDDRSDAALVIVWAGRDRVQIQRHLELVINTTTTIITFLMVS